MRPVTFALALLSTVTLVCATGSPGASSTPAAAADGQRAAWLRGDAM